MAWQDASPGIDNRESPRNQRSGLSRFVAFLCLLTLGSIAQGFFVSAARAETAARAGARSFSVTTEMEAKEASPVARDSLMAEFRRYSAMVRVLRDSLAAEKSEARVAPETRERLQGNIDEIIGGIERIGDELKRYELKVKENRISLVNEAGEGVIVNIPENLPPGVSKGLEAITQGILDDLPDSITVAPGFRFDWKSFVPEAPPPPRRKIKHGNLVAVRDDLVVEADEDVRGNAVVVLGDLVVDGRVDGDAVCIFGRLTLSGTAEVTGQVVAVGGALERDPDAIVGGVKSIKLLGDTGGGVLSGLFGNRLLSFVGCQGLFLTMLVLALLAVVVVPRRFIDAVAATLRRSPGPAFGVGLVAAVAGHVVAVILMVILSFTVIGLPLAALLALALLAMMVVGVATCGLVMGNAVCARLGRECAAPWLAVVVGLTLLHAVSFLGAVFNLTGAPGALTGPLMGLGAAIKVVAYLFGLGALILSRFGTRPAA